MDFSDAVIPPDSTPVTSDVEYPCRNCGKEAGPYGGRGPKPKLCTDCKPRTGKRAAKVTGAPANYAAQATGVLVQLNGMLAMGAMALQMFGTASAIADANNTFEEQAYQALLTDPELCKLLLKGGVKSAKVSLGLAYVGMAAAVGPIAVTEIKEKKAERDARKAEEEANAAD